MDCSSRISIVPNFHFRPSILYFRSYFFSSTSIIPSLPSSGALCGFQNIPESGIELAWNGISKRDNFPYKIAPSSPLSSVKANIFPRKKACTCSVPLFPPSSFLQFSQTAKLCLTVMTGCPHVSNMKNTGLTTKIKCTTMSGSPWGDSADGTTPDDQFSIEIVSVLPSLRSPTFSPYPLVRSSKSLYCAGSLTSQSLAGIKWFLMLSGRLQTWWWILKGN